MADVAACGQGAPITSTMDVLCLAPPLSSDPSTWRAIQNIGGIGNVTFVPHPASSSSPLAFDTGPGNVLIDMAAAAVAAGTSSAPTRAEDTHVVDIDGVIARSGAICAPLLAVMMAHPYLALVPPKTTGREVKGVAGLADCHKPNIFSSQLFTKELFTEWWELGQSHGATGPDLLATFTEFTAASIADGYARFCPGEVSQVNTELQLPCAPCLIV